MNWRKIFFLLLMLVCTAELSAQRDTAVKRTDTSKRKKPDTTFKKTDTTKRRVDTTKRRIDTTQRKKDTTKPIIKPVTPQPPTPKPIVTPVYTDTTTKDSASVVTDSLNKDTTVVIIKPAVVYKDTTTYYAYFHHPYIGFGKPPVYMVMKERTPQSKDNIFYLLAGLLFFVAFIKLLFPKYFQNIFRLFFQTNFRQKQTRDQLLQQGLGSLLLNLLFFLSGAVYITLVLQHYHWTVFPFWQLLLYSSLLLLVLYAGKFLFLSFAGWIFNVKDGAQTYIFIVFLINKIIGVMLIPFILVVAFSDAVIADAAITASVILVALLFFYRYFISLKSFRRDLHINPFHFFLYLCGVEIVPLLVIGKAVFNYIDGRF